MSASIMSNLLKVIEDCRPFANKISKDPEDAIQDATVMALVYLKNNALPAEPKSWFMTLIRYANNKKIEKDTRVKRNCSKVNERYADKLVDPYPVINARLDLDSALSSLGPDEKLARLYYLEGKTMQELARMQGTSKPTVSRQIDTIERKLKQWGQHVSGEA
jgi:RNA polymerase sigma factor (sigma-70 family)